MKTKVPLFYIRSVLFFSVVFMGNVNLIVAQQIITQQPYSPMAIQPPNIENIDVYLKFLSDNEYHTWYSYPLSQDVFFIVLKKHYPTLSEQYSQALAENNRAEINVLFKIREQLKPDFVHWDRLNDFQKQLLERLYASLWKRLLELCEFDETILKEYKSELNEDGNNTPSLVFAWGYVPYGTGVLYQEVHKEFVTLLKNTKNAATISNCCNVMIMAYKVASDPVRWERLHFEKPSIRQLELLENPNCWDLFQEKQKALRLDPLTEHTAMGIILLDEAFAYQWAYVEEQKIIQSSIHPGSYPPQKSADSYIPKLHYLFNMEKIMTGPPPTLKGPFYGNEIKKILETDALTRKQ